jgi:predicted nucleic acid-binding protein
LRAFFYDTWAFLALANAADPWHASSVEADRKLEARGLAGVTSDYILDETVTSLHVAAGYSVAVRFLDLIEARIQGKDILLAEVGAPRRERALALFRRLGRNSPRLSFTDCTSFAIMHELGIRSAFTADTDFHRAGGGVRPLFVRRGGMLQLELPEGSS